MGDVRHVGADRLAEVGDLVDKADLGRQKGVGGVLDHLGAHEVRDDEGHGRLGPRIQLRREALLHDGLVEGPQELQRLRRVGPDHDPVWE